MISARVMMWDVWRLRAVEIAIAGSVLVWFFYIFDRGRQSPISMM
jgi:hypothetical protein